MHQIYKRGATWTSLWAAITSLSQFRIHPYARISTYFRKPKLFPSGHISIYRNIANKSFIFSVVSFVISESILCSCLSRLRSSMILTPNFQKNWFMNAASFNHITRLCLSFFLFNLTDYLRDRYKKPSKYDRSLVIAKALPFEWLN